MRIHVNETVLYVDVQGSQRRVAGTHVETRPTVVVLHGGPGFDQGYLRPGLDPLSEAAQLVFIDLRGQGNSDTVALATCTLEQMADDVAAVCSRLGLDEPIVFGHSAGGFVALHLALRHPGLAAGLILCDTAPTLSQLPDDSPPPGLEQRAPESAVEVARAMFSGDFSAERIHAFRDLVMPYYAAPGHQDVPGRIMPLSRIAADVAAHFFAELAPRYDIRDQLQAVDIPVLVLVGEFDWVCPPVYSRVLAGRIPSACLEVIDAAGHFPFSEEPVRFRELCTAFIEAR